MISGIFIYGLRGEVLASRIYKDGLKRAVTDVFRIKVISNPDCTLPILTLGSTAFIHIRHDNLYIVAITRHDVDAALVYELLFKLVEVATSALGKFDEANCTTKVNIVYELLSEIVDFGYPQHTDAGLIDQILGISNPKFSMDLFHRDKSRTRAALSRTATSATPWRSTNIKHRNNEIYVDILESINAVLSSDGALFSSSVSGRVRLRTQLSGMPRCAVALNDEPDEDERAHLEDFQFHQCVDIPEFQRSHRISFIPPDGEFDLLKYSVVHGVTLPFKIKANLQEAGKTHIEYTVSIAADFAARVSASNVVVRVPVPPTTIKTNFKVSRGKVKYNSSKQSVEWRLPRISGGNESKLSGTADMAATHGLWSRPPIMLEFSISMYCGSGLKLQYLKLDESVGYKPLKWVRYFTSNGSYEVRI